MRCFSNGGPASDWLFADAADNIVGLTKSAALELADFLLAGWQGAMLRMKVERSPAPLERFKTIAFATVFKRTDNE